MRRNKASKKKAKKIGNAPSSRIIVEPAGTRYEYKEYFAYVVADAPLEEKIVQALRVELNDKQIQEYLGITREKFIEIVKEKYSNPGHLKLLVSFLPINITEYVDMLQFRLGYRKNVELVLKEGVSVENLAGQLNLGIKELYSYIKNEFGGLEGLQGKEEVEEEKEVFFKSVTMEEYADLFGFNELHFDFNKIDNNIINNVPNMTFDDFIDKYNYAGIKDIIYVRTQLLGIYQQSTAFYPAEDIILETIYPKVGVRVLEILKEVISNYRVRETEEYSDRLKVLKRVRIHPKNSWGITKQDARLIRLLCEKKVTLNNKYIPWLSTAEVQYYANSLGYTDEKPTTKEIEYVEIENLDITPYIEQALKMREVKYHSEKWTAERHEFFKENYREVGIEIADKINWATKAECMMRAKQFLIKQRYKEEDNERIREIFLLKGFEGVKEAYPNRTDTALKYKIEELGLKEGVITSVVSEEQLAKLRAEMLEIVREEETERIRREVLSDLKREMEKELTPTIEQKVRKNVEYTVRKELVPQLREKEVVRVKKEIDTLIESVLENNLRLSITTAVSKTPPRDFGTRLVAEVYQSVVDGLKVELDKIS